MALARYANGRQQTAKTSCTLEYKRYKKNAWKTTKELDRHHTTRFEKHRRDLGSSAITCNFHAYVLTDKSEIAASLMSSSHCRISIRHDASVSKSNFLSCDLDHWALRIGL